MEPNSSQKSGPNLELGDLYYILFRQKWKIILCTLLGLGGGYAYYKKNPPSYQSEARLFIRFVISDRAVDPGEEASVTLSPDSRGATILNSELQVLTSRDLSEIVAKNIGPEKILANVSEGKSLGEAASVVRSGLTVVVPNRSSIVQLVYQHPDSEMAPTILRETIAAYLKRHQEIHRAAGMVGDFLAQETDQLRARLTQIEEELRKANAKAGIVSLEQSKEAIASQTTRIRSQIFDAQLELASRTSIYEQMTKLKTPGAGAPESESAPTPVPPQQIAAYQKIVAQINQLRAKEQDLLNYFKEGAARVQEVRAQLAQAESQREQLVTEHPGLTQMTPAVVSAAATPAGTYDPLAEAAQITALQARVKMLLQQWEQLRTEAGNLDQLEGTIIELRRNKDLVETNYRRYAASMEQARIKEAMGDGKVSNISIVQSPTPPFRDWMPARKIAAGIGAGGLFLGLAWAALIELLLDRSLRRPADVERQLHAPLFISIPNIKTRRRGRKTKALPPASATTAALPDGEQAVDPTKPRLPLAVPTPPAPDHSELEPFHQTLRDRLISYFESINLRHKPKLIAVTGLGRDSGVTTTAAGLARSLSETGEGNVLLVDMTQGQGSAQHFQRGTQVGLDQLLDTRDSAFVRDNLYVVSEHSGSDRLSKGLPQRFNQLVPKLKASDFDYIIFDMPPVSQISITPRLAGFMDMTLLVLESEKTDRHIAKRATDLLVQSKTNVGVVLNKNKAYVPAVLHQDREFLLGI